MNETASLLVARWLAHKTGVGQAFVLSLMWFALPAILGLPENAAVFWYLAFCTFISFATQFTLAYQNAKNERANEQQLRNQMDMMRLLVAYAERDEKHGLVVEQSHVRLGAAIADLDQEIDLLREVALESRATHIRNGRNIAKLVKSGQSMIDGDAAEGRRKR